MEKINVMRTPVEVLAKLEARGEANEFRLAESGEAFTDTKHNKTYPPEALTIIKTYRFEGESDPGDMSVIYLLKTNDGERGYIQDAYGTYSADLDRYAQALKAIPMEQPNAAGTSDSENDERGQNWAGIINYGEAENPANHDRPGDDLQQDPIEPVKYSRERDPDNGRNDPSSITERFFS